MEFKVISTYIRLFNEFSSFIGGGRPQNKPSHEKYRIMHIKMSKSKNFIFVEAIIGISVHFIEWFGSFKYIFLGKTIYIA